MRLQTLLLVIFFIFTLACNGQLPKHIAWQTFLGDLERHDVSDIDKYGDNKYILSGTWTERYGGPNRGEDMQVWILSEEGKLINNWRYDLGGRGRSRQILANHDGSFLIFGNSECLGGDGRNNHYNKYRSYKDHALIKCNAEGEKLWHLCIGSSGHEFVSDRIAPLIRCATGGYFLVLDYDHWNPNSEPGIYDGDLPDSSYGGRDLRILKISEQGNIIFNKRIGGSGDELVQHIQNDNLGNVIITGQTASTDYDFDGLDEGIFTLKLSSNGEIVSLETSEHPFKNIKDSVNISYVSPLSPNAKYYTGNLGKAFEHSPNIKNHHDTVSFINDIFFGVNNTFSTASDLQYIGGVGQDNLLFTEELADGILLLSGHTSAVKGDWAGLRPDFVPYSYTDPFFLLVDSTGVILDKTVVGFEKWESLRDYIYLPNGDIIAVARNENTAQDENGNYAYAPNVWVFKLSHELTGTYQNESDSPFTLYPNPASNQVTIQLSSFTETTEVVIYNALGISVKKIPINQTKTSLYIGDLARGIYFLNLQTAKGGNHVARLVVE